jgi:hypothetical protein
MTSITQENPIGRPRFKLIKPTLLENEAPTTKCLEVAHFRCSPVQELITRIVQESSQKDPVPNMASGIHRFCPIFPQSPMLIKHRPGHLTKGTILPLNYTILTSHIGRGNLMFETQITTKGFEMRVFKLLPLSLRIAPIASPCLKFFNLKIRSLTKPNVSPLSAKKKTQA